MEKILREVTDKFDLGHDVYEVEPYGEGHINTTYQVLVRNGVEKRYILQKINTNIFTDVDGLMGNIYNVTSFLKNIIEKNGGDTLRETLTVVKTKDGELYAKDHNGDAWRVYVFVEDTICMQKVESDENFYTVGAVFGNFQNMLSDFDASVLCETIPNFHHTPTRLETFKKALSEDKLGRAKDVQAEIDFVLSREKDCHVLVDLLNDGKLPLRVTHNDTKLNNILFDNKTKEGICVIDLDTVMPGLSLNDFGDSIRFGANDCAEDEKDMSKVNFSLHLFDVFTKGYLSTAKSALTETEIDNLPWGAKMMTLECGIRFLTDYLMGDVYFKVHRDGQNLDRARTQFKLVSDMENCWQEMHDVVKKY